MNIDGKFTFGQYKSLSLREVYQGTDRLDDKLLCSYLRHCLQSASVPRPTFLSCSAVIVDVDIIKIKPDIFNEEVAESETNVIHIGDVSAELQAYFNNFFKGNCLGIVISLAAFNHANGQTIVGGDPEYIEWCLGTIENFQIDDTTKRELESFEVNRLKGITVRMLRKNIYSYETVVHKEFFKFKS